MHKTQFKNLLDQKRVQKLLWCVTLRKSVKWIKFLNSSSFQQCEEHIFSYYLFLFFI